MAKPMWVIQKAEKQDNTMELYLYDDIVADSEDWWSGEKIESDTSANHIQRVLEESKDAKQINIYINSYGGDVKEGLAIYNQLKRHSANKTVYIDGFACSIAAVIAMVGNKIIMGSNTLMMIHHAWTYAMGNPKELRKAADDLEVIDSASCSSFSAKSNGKISEEKLTELLDNETWLTPEQCLEYGFCDEIAGKEDTVLETAKQRFKQAMQNEIKQHNQSKKVPERFNQSKTNAEKLMAIFKKKMEE